MANPVATLWRIPELRAKITFTFLCLVVYRIGAHITAPGIDVGVLRTPHDLAHRDLDRALGVPLERVRSDKQSAYPAPLGSVESITTSDPKTVVVELLDKEDHPFRSREEIQRLVKEILDEALELAAKNPDIRAVRDIPNPPSLDEIKANPKLLKMVLVVNSRLSVQPVAPDEWEEVCRMGGLTPAP